MRTHKKISVVSPARPRSSLLANALNVLVIFICTLALPACGKKGNPTLKTFEKPPAVSGVLVAHTEEGLLVTWAYPQQNRAAVKGFYLERAEGQDCKEFVNKGFLAKDTLRFVDGEFGLGRTYCYRVRAYSLRDVISDSSPVVRATPVALPAPPERLTYTISGDTVEIRGEGRGEGIRYNIYKSAIKGEQPRAPLNSTPLAEPVFKDRAEPTRAVVYTFRSVVDNGMVNEGPPSEALDIGPASFVPSQASGLRFVAMPGAVHLQWNENPEPWVAGYRIYRRGATEEEYTVIGEVISPAFTDPAPPASKALYAVAAVGPGQAGALSAPVAVAPYVER